MAWQGWVFGAWHFWRKGEGWFCAFPSRDRGGGGGGALRCSSK
uniref:Uncharacterized protein n=1 Tax=Anguilla anguilla TaxID=7936 RepID=A0A0E9SX16_ANGAN